MPPPGLRIEHIVTAGTFSLDGGVWDVENNVWVIGDDRECAVIDAPHAIEPIAQLIGDRRLIAVLCTHAHDDHVTVAVELGRRFNAPVRLHPGDEILWRQSYPDESFEQLADEETIGVAGTTLTVLHSPGHSPGAVCYFAPDLGVVFTGDTLFAGGPGATGRSFSNFATIIDSIRSRLFTLPEDTVVHTGHGDSTTIGNEKPHVDEWIARGH